MDARAPRLSIVDHDPAWAGAFASERELLATVFGDSAVAIEHVGSTAVPGLPAKPIIDIAVELYDIEHLAGRIDDVEALGYAYRGDGLHPGRHFFRKPPDSEGFHRRTHNLHVHGLGHPDFVEVIAFRDYLSAKPGRAAEYAALKRRLAARGLDGMAYTDAKTAFIHDCLREIFRG